LNFAIFSIFGYISVLLWLVAAVLLWLHYRGRPRRWRCHYAISLVLAAFILAQINSKFYVNHLQVDQSEAVAAAHAKQAAARKMAEDERGGDVAQIRFAEDDRADFMDMAGLDEADRKYIETIDESVTPEWKQQKRQRSATPAEDDSLEAQLDTTEKAGGVASGELEQKDEKGVVLPEKMVMLANRLDGLNIKLIRWFLLAGIVVLVVDYLQRFNRAEEAYLPLPFPSALVNSLAPLPVVCTIPSSHRRSQIEDLAWLVRRGDSFIFLTTDTAVAAAIPDQMPRFPRGRCPVDVLHVKADDPLINDEFIFEGLWYNRAAFVIDSAIRAESFLTGLYERLVDRRQTRARVRQTVHIVWALDVPLADMLHEDVIRLAGAAGMSLREMPLKT